MAERYDEQYRGDRGPQRHDRGFVERAGDEVRSWFGDDDAERRRQMDDREADRYRMRDRMSGGGSWGRGEDRGHDRPNYGSGYRSDRPENPRHGSETGSSRDYRGYEQSYGPYYGQGFGPSYGQGFGPSYGQGYNQSFDQGYGQRSPQHYGQPSGYGDDAGRGRMSGFERPGGSFSGRGPKNYQRSDARINEDVCDRLCESSEVDASEIEVSVSGGEVTLSGTVFDRNDKRRAEDLAEQVSGVREVHNNLRVARGQDRSGVSGPLGLSDAPSTGQGRQAQGQGSVGPSGAGQSGAGTSGASMSTGSNPGITGGGPSGASDASNPSAPEKTSTAGGRR